MQKSIYICLITLFCSLSAFAGPYDEYGYNNSSFGSPMYNTGAMGGGTYWAQLATDFYTQSNAVNPYSYSQTIETKVQTSDQGIRVVGDKPASTPTTVVKKDVEQSRASGWDVWLIYPAVTTTSTREQTVNIAQANTTVLTSYGPNTYFNFNVYNPVQQNYAYNTYQANSTGPVLVASTTQSGAPPLSAPYNAIPRTVSTGPLDASPGSKFQTAITLYNQQTLTLSEANKVIVDFIDRVIPDAPNGRIQFVGNVISKVAAGLTPAENGQAADLLKDYIASDVVDDDTTVQNPIIENTDYVFDEKGGLKAINSNGTGVVQITTKDGPKSPSQLDVNNLDHRKALSRVAIFLAKKVKAPVGTIISSGTGSTSLNSLAYTEPTPPHAIKLNYKSGAFSKDLDNIYSFTNILEHELGHRKNFLSTNPHIPNTLSTHVDVYIDAMEKTSFKQSSPEFKLSIVSSLADYIWNMDKKGYTFQQVKEKIDTFNGRSQFNGGYRLIAPKDPNTSNILFKQGELNVKNFTVYDPETNTEVPVTFTINNEK